MSLKLTPGDKKFLSILKVGVAEDVLPDWKDYAHALERESLLHQYIAKLDAENFGLWVANVAEGVLIGALISGLMYGWWTNL